MKKYVRILAGAFTLAALSASAAQVPVAQVPVRTTRIFLDPGRSLTHSFVVDSSSGKSKETGKPVFLIRLLGESLKKEGVVNAMPNPIFEIYRDGKRWAPGDGVLSGSSSRILDKIQKAEADVGLRPSELIVPGDAIEVGTFPDGAYDIVIRPGPDALGKVQGGEVLLQIWEVYAMEEPNRAPSIYLPDNNERSGKIGVPLKINILSSDPDGHEDLLGYSVIGDIKISGGGNGEDGWDFFYIVSSTPGEKLITVSALDRQGKESKPITLSILFQK